MFRIQKDNDKLQVFPSSMDKIKLAVKIMKMAIGGEQSLQFQRIYYQKVTEFKFNPLKVMNFFFNILGY